VTGNGGVLASVENITTKKNLFPGEGNRFRRLEEH